MLSFEERLALLEAEIAVTTPEDILKELNSYEVKGPLAYGYLEEVEFTVKCVPSAIYLKAEIIKVYTDKTGNTGFQNDAYTESLAMAA